MIILLAKNLRLANTCQLLEWKNAQNANKGSKKIRAVIVWHATNVNPISVGIARNYLQLNINAIIILPNNVEEYSIETIYNDSTYIIQLIQLISNYWYFVFSI